MQIDVITLFPKMFESPFGESIIGRAIKNNLLSLKLHNMRDWAWNSYGAVDDKPYGGGVGMLIRVDVIDKALKQIKKNNSRVILTSARGKKFSQQDAQRLAKYENLVFICGHYEGFDQRVSEMVDEEISIGDYVLTGGELPTMIMVDAITRLLPGVLGKDASSQDESHCVENYIEYPQYTRPQIFGGIEVPEVLLSGDPKKIEDWQKSEQSKSGHK